MVDSMRTYLQPYCHPDQVVVNTPKQAFPLDCHQLQALSTCSGLQHKLLQSRIACTAGVQGVLIQGVIGTELSKLSRWKLNNSDEGITLGMGKQLKLKLNCCKSFEDAT